MIRQSHLILLPSLADETCGLKKLQNIPWDFCTYDVVAGSGDDAAGKWIERSLSTSSHPCIGLGMMAISKQIAYHTEIYTLEQMDPALYPWN